MPKPPAYAFAQPHTAQSSSAASRQAEQERFYNPLPAPQSQSSTQQSNLRTSARQPNLQINTNNSNSNNPFTDNYASRSPSPLVNTPSSKPLLSQSQSNAAQMPGSSASTSRSYGPRATPSSGMPARGESQSALLGDQRPSRRYGPTASAAPINASTALLASRSNSNAASSPSTERHAALASEGSSGQTWNAGLEGMSPEDDDYLHNPDEKRDRKGDRGGTIFTSRGLINIGCLIILVLGIITLFAGYPIISYYTQKHQTTNGAYNLGGINSTGQVPLITNFVSLIDSDTPSSAMTRTGFDGNQYNLVFSDEFNKDGRTFFDGDDPYWTAIDFHYWPTGDYEWYDPSGATTKDGNLVITMNQENIHDLNFKSGMLQSWNKLCFQYSFYIEVRVSLPGTPAVGGFWPGVWTMGNLGRPGYGATTEGTWPYSYDSCDIGTLPNQTNVAQTGPTAALTTGSDGGVISYLPGQRVSACTCSGEDHPGPNVGVGRAAPEIDIIEAQTDLSIPRGQVSQSFQIAPFDDGYWPVSNTTPAMVQYDTTKTKFNSYRGGTYQQALSSLTYVSDSVYQLTSGQFGVYGFEMYSNPDKRSDGYITWVSEGVKSWQITAAAAGPNSVMQIGQRLIPEEPMSMVINFGQSDNFQKVDFAHLTYPAQMLVDYVRVYQRPDVGKMGCDPADHPTADYISKHANAYSNPNLTTWAGAGYTFPKNSLQGC